jgi:glycosyltransferase involved in cell wall biosynthesis
VLPCYDEAANVADAVAEATSAARRCSRTHEVIVVDDGSGDGTAALVEGIAVIDDAVRLVSHPHNLGYGAAVRSGIAATRLPWVLLTDGDLQFRLDELESMLPLARESDLVAGYRVGRADSAGRRAAAYAWNALIRATFDVTIRDVDCAFKLMRGDAVRALALQSEGAMISTELLVRARAAGWRIVEQPVHHRPRTAGRSSGGSPRVVVRAFRERRGLARRLRDERRGRAGAWQSARPKPT